MLGDGKTVRVRGDGHSDAVALAVIEVDIIVAHAVLGDDLEVLRRREQRAGQLDDAHEHGVRVHDLAADDVHVAVGVDDGVPRRGQQLGSDGVDDSVMRIFAMMLPPLQAQAVGLAELQQLFVDRLRHLNTVWQHFLPPCGRQRSPGRKISSTPSAFFSALISRDMGKEPT